MNEIEKNWQDYKRNYQKAEKAYLSGDIKEHKRLCNKEERLWKKGIEIRKRLGVFIPDPCTNKKCLKKCRITLLGGCDLLQEVCHER